MQWLLTLCESIHEINNLKTLKAEGNYYRIRLGDYRFGLIIENDTVCFVRLLHRSEATDSFFKKRMDQFLFFPIKEIK